MNDQFEVLPPMPRTKVGKPVRTRRSRWLTPLIALVIIGLTGYGAWRLLASPARPGPNTRTGAPPQSIGVASVTTGDLDVVMTGLGAVTPLATVTVVTQINGQLTQVAFTEGQAVHKGDFLAQIDPRPYQVALEQAQGTLAHDQGLLAQAKADYARYATLNKQNSISKQQVEDQAYLIRQYEGSVVTDQGAVDSAKLNLTYCHITSPIDGRVGIRLVDPGNYVQTSNTSGLFVLTQETPMSVIFTLPEDDVSEIRSQMANGTLVATAFDRTNTKQLAIGKLATIDNQIDNATGTLKLRAMFDNAKGELFPQQFVNIRLLVRTIKGAVVAPQQAIQTGAPGEFVYLVKPGNTVAVQVVKTGVTSNGKTQILDGVKPGDEVVTDGLDRLKDGARISIAASPGDAGAAPTPRRGNRPQGGPPTQGTPPAQ